VEPRHVVSLRSPCALTVRTVEAITGQRHDGAVPLVSRSASMCPSRTARRHSCQVGLVGAGLELLARRSFRTDNRTVRGMHHTNNTQTDCRGRRALWIGWHRFTLHCKNQNTGHSEREVSPPNSRLSIRPPALYRPSDRELCRKLALPRCHCRTSSGNVRGLRARGWCVLPLT
jgi:hypothetical protein